MSSPFLDEAGNELNYWPISNLVENETSEVIVIQVPIPAVMARLRAITDPRARVWAKWMAFPLNPFINISTSLGISLNGVPGPYADFSIYVEALSPIEVFERVPLTVAAALVAPAGWTV